MTHGNAAPDEVYDAYIDEARAAIRDRDFSSAEHLARQALAREPERAAAYNILAAVRELNGHLQEARDLLCAGLAVEPTYRPARDNLTRLGAHPRDGGILLGDEARVKPMETRMKRHPSVQSAARKASRRAPLLSGDLLAVALRESISMLLPQRMVKNPVMFVTELGAVLSTLSGLSAIRSASSESAAYQFAVSAVLWATVLFANFAEALAEARGKAQTQALRETRRSTEARRRNVDGSRETVASTDLRSGDIVVISVGETIPADGEIVEGVASIDESAITGESAPVVREAGGDRSGVTGGTRVLSDEIVVRVTAETGDSFLDRMIALVEGAKRQKTPNEIALTIMLAGLTLAFLMVTVSLLPMASFFDARIDLSTAIALLVCLIPTTIGGLLAAIGIAGMDRALKSNVLAKSGKAVEIAGDIDTVLLDKTGTITQGNRQATDLVSAQGVSPGELARAALLASLADATPEGKSLVALCQKQLDASLELPDDAQPIAFSAQTRLSGVDLADGRQLRKGAVDAIERWLEKRGGGLPEALRANVDEIARGGGTPLVVVEGGSVLGIVALSDVLKAGIKQRFERLRAMGLRVVMVTGDNPLTAAAIAKEAGVDDFIAEATPEDKLAYIRKEQEGGRLVAMMGDGTNDAPALAQADIGLAMNSGTQAAKEAGNMVDLDSDPTKLIEVVEIGKQLLMTRGALTTFSIANDVAKYFAIVPALFIAAMPSLEALNIMALSSPRSAILSAVIFNAIIIPALIPVALKGVGYRPATADQLLQRNLLVYGLGGLVSPFIGIKGIDLALSALGVA